MKADPKCRIHAADTEQTKHDQQVAKKGQPAERKQQADKLLANEITPNDEHPLAEREPCPQRKPADREWQSHQRNTQATAAWKAGVGELQHLDFGAESGAESLDVPKGTKRYPIDTGLEWHGLGLSLEGEVGLFKRLCSLRRSSLSMPAA